MHPKYTPKDIERFYAKVSKTPTEQGCLEWLAYRNPLGYGSFGVGGTTVGAHRVAWEIVNGLIPVGLVIRHVCHNRLCCNPAHLLLGTQADNVADMMSSGRWHSAPNTRAPYVWPTREERFYAKVSKIPTDRGCLEWSGAQTTKGYGLTRSKGRNTTAHRIAWELVNGQIPDGMLVCHKCDNPRCCNVDHLFLGTPEDNQRDMDNKGRRVRITVLTQAQVMEMRSGKFSGWSDRKIALYFGISRSHAQKIRKRESWAHI